MAKILIVFLSLVIAQSALAKLQCYTCPRVTEECEVKDAIAVPCTGVDPHCSKQTRLGMPESTKAIRKCVLPEGRDKIITCPANFECHNCDKDICNSAVLAKISQLGLISVVLALFLPRFVL